MEVRPPYTLRNVFYAALMLAHLAFYAYQVWPAIFPAPILPGSYPHGDGTLLWLVGLPLMLYAAAFAVRALVLALRRGSRPLAGWVVVLAFLPTILATILMLTVLL